MRLRHLFIGIFGIIHVEGALHLTSPWLFKSRKSLKASASTGSLESQASKECASKGKCPLSLKVPSSHSTPSPSPRVYTPSSPIPIPFSEEALKEVRKEKSKKPFYFVEDVSSDSSSSASSTASEKEMSPEIFTMSYEPEYAKIHQTKMEAKKERKLLKKKLKKEEKIKNLQQRRNNPSHGIHYANEDEFDVEDYSKLRLERCRLAPTYNLGLNPSKEDLDNDSDFGDQAKEPCYSLSF